VGRCLVTNVDWIDSRQKTPCHHFLLFKKVRLVFPTFLLVFLYFSYFHIFIFSLQALFNFLTFHMHLSLAHDRLCCGRWSLMCSHLFWNLKVGGWKLEVGGWSLCFLPSHLCVPPLTKFNYHVYISHLHI
jgi:hypothetical protein